MMFISDIPHEHGFIKLLTGAMLQEELEKNMYAKTFKESRANYAAA
jgi:hypothetical protein